MWVSEARIRNTNTKSKASEDWRFPDENKSGLEIPNLSLHSSNLYVLGGITHKVSHWFI
jgi:hypothetical protein